MVPAMRIALLLLTSLLAASVTAAQDTRKVTVRSLCFAHVGGLKTAEFVQPDGATLEVPLWLGEPSDDIRLEAKGNTLAFFDPDAPQEDNPKPIATGTLGAAARQLLFFVPSGQKSPAYRVLAFPDDQRAFPMGNTRLLNLAKVPAIFKMGEHAIKVAPGRASIAPMPRKVNKYNDYNFEIVLETEKGLYPVRQTRGRAVKSKRDMAVVWIDPSTKRARVNLYTDIPPWSLPGADAPPE